MTRKKKLHCDNPLLFHRTLVGGRAHGEKVADGHDLRLVRTAGEGTYRSLSFCAAAREKGFGVDIWFHESISDTQAILWAGGLFDLDDWRLEH